MTIDAQTRDFLSHLHRGGQWGYWWTAQGRQSFWWEAGRPTALPGGRRDTYFGVHPCDAIPSTNRRGEPREPVQLRAHISDVAAINCFYGDFDAKDYGDKTHALNHIQALTIEPSVVIDSGGGYHCYWLLCHPWKLDSEEARCRAAAAQAAWVTYVGADEQVKDLARVLRAPGTYNWKYDPPPKVGYISFDLDRTYRLEDLVALLPAPDPAQAHEVAGVQPSDRAGEWARRKLSDAIRMVATAAPHTRHNVMIKAARLAGGVTPHVSEADIVRALSAAYNGEEDDREVERVILDGIAYGQAKPLAPPPTPPALVWRSGAAYCPSCGGVARQSKFYDDGLFCSCQRPALVWRGDETKAPAGVAEEAGWRDDDDAPTVTLVAAPTMPHGITTLIDTPPPPVIWFAPGFLREGSGLIVGQPNVGKTPLAAQLGLSLAAGVPWLGSIPVEQCKVLYIGCEYSKQELYPLLTESMAAMRLKLRREITDDNFAYKTQDDALPIDPDGAIADLEFYISLGFRVIIIDTLTAFLPPEKFKQNVYRGDYKELQPYHRLALKHSVAILGVWHASKRESDPKLMYNGSTGMWAVPSSRISMYEDDEGRKRISSFPRLGDRSDLALTQEKGIMGRRWVVADANPEPLQLSATERTIYRWLSANTNKANPRTVSTIAEMTGVNPNTVKSALSRMFDENLVQRGERGAYFVGSSGSSASFGSSGSFASSVKDDLTQDPFGSSLDLLAPRQDAVKPKDPKDPTFSGSTRMQAASYDIPDGVDPQAYMAQRLADLEALRQREAGDAE